jgi:hypothetical protein
VSDHRRRDDLLELADRRIAEVVAGRGQTLFSRAQPDSARPG